MNTPFAGFDHRSATESSTAMVVPAMPRVSDGTVRNWSPLATGTVRMGMSWALRGEKVRREANMTAMGAGMRCWGLMVVF